MVVDYLIVGQGLCGTFLSWNLLKQGKTVLVIDQSKPNTSSKVASGVINPVTGRRIVRSWMIDELLPFAEQAYAALGADLDATLARRLGILNFHATPQMRDAFNQRVAEGEPFLQNHDEAQWTQYLNFIYGIGEVAPSLLIDLNTMISGWRNRLSEAGLMLEEKFDAANVRLVNTGITYGDITAEKIIFCDGTGSINNPWFSFLPFATNKGEALIVHIPGLPSTHILKQGLSIAPWDDELFWVGSSYQWVFQDDKPTEGFRVKTQQALQFLLKVPFTIIDHIAAERPATIERRPFVGLHPKYNQVGILNGMGTKGCSLAPYFARELTDYLLQKKAITPEADVQRFSRILTSGRQ